MKVLITMLLSLSLACATNYNWAQAKAVRDLARQGYDLSAVSIDGRIMVVDDRKHIPYGKAGFYDPYTKDIILLSGCPDYAAVHEWKHRLLDEIGVPCLLHHDIINKKIRRQEYDIHRRLCQPHARVLPKKRGYE